MSPSKKPNRLIHEKSPYLQQHAYNPVDWYPWGEEAFEASRSQNKPIFLSIGYATCQWCHVMEKESFENEEIAALLNDTFINIKVDKEELPEVDSVYMDLAQVLMSSSGGWPLNVILTPELKPFFAITYMPAKTQRGMMGLKEFAEQIKQVWEGEEKPLLEEQAEKLFMMFEQTKEPPAEEMPTKDHIEQTIGYLLSMADTAYGGFKGEPKFPLTFQISLLLQFAKARSDNRCLLFAMQSLDAMSQGGIYDHIGGGFSRYSVDETWTIPHFEKMLYDNALLAKAYFEAWKMTKKESYKKVCEEICNYILRDMTDEEGGFYSAEDADSEGEEGRFYTWQMQEIQKVLSPEEAEVFCAVYNVTLEGNFEGRNVFHQTKSLEHIAQSISLSLPQVEELLNTAKKKLFAIREKRERPFVDDKVIVGWNGLMIDALCKIGSAFENGAWKEAAVKACRFIKDRCFKEGRLYRRYRDGETRFPAILDDYAFLIKACLSLFEEQLGNEWLEFAIELSRIVERDFKSATGAFYYSAQDDKTTPLRKCEFYDGSEPSGNAVHAENLLRLYQMTFDDQYRSLAEDVLASAKHHIETYPPGSCYSILALARYLDLTAPTLVVALDESQLLKEEIAREISASYSPHLQVVWLKSGAEGLHRLLPFVAEKKPIDGQTAVYICDLKGCKPPLLQMEDISKAIHDL